MEGLVRRRGAMAGPRLMKNCLPQLRIERPAAAQAPAAPPPPRPYQPPAVRPGLR